MPQCDKCGQSHDGADCQLCKTTTGIDLAQLAGSPITTSSVSPGESSPVYLEEASTHQRFPIPIPMCRVGRDMQNDIVITGDNGISRNQFVISHEDGYFYLMDLGSKNGTMLNGKGLTERSTLSDGDYVQVGNLRFRFIVAGDVAVDGGHSDFIRYLEAKHSYDTSKDTYEPAPTLDVDLPDEARSALEKAFTVQEHVMDEKNLLEVEETAAEASETAEDQAYEAPKEREEPAVKPQEWCPKYMQEEFSRLEREMANLNDVVSEARRKMQDCESRMRMMRSLTKSLLSATGDELVEACTRVLQMLGWKIKRSEKDRQELLLNSEQGGFVIARVTGTLPKDPKDPKAVQHDVDLGTLAISQVFHWIKQKVEPKGIMIVRPFDGGNGVDSTFSQAVEEYARKKNVCIMTTPQLLYMFRQLNQNVDDAETFKQTILSTVGVLQGYGAESSEPSVAA